MIDTPGIGNNTFKVQFNKDWLCNNDILNSKLIIALTGRAGYRLFRQLFLSSQLAYHIKVNRYNKRHGIRR